MTPEEIRTAAAISDIFFFHSTSAEDFRAWFDTSTTENLCVNGNSVLLRHQSTTTILR